MDLRRGTALVVAFAGWGTFLHRRLAPALDADLGLQCSCPDALYGAAKREQAGEDPACKHAKSLRAALPKCPILV